MKVVKVIVTPVLITKTIARKMMMRMVKKMKRIPRRRIRMIMLMLTGKMTVERNENQSSITRVEVVVYD